MEGTAGGACGTYGGGGLEERGPLGRIRSRWDERTKIFLKEI